MWAQVAQHVRNARNYASIKTGLYQAALSFVERRNQRGITRHKIFPLLIHFFSDIFFSFSAALLGSKPVPAQLLGVVSVLGLRQRSLSFAQRRLGDRHVVLVIAIAVAVPAAVFTSAYAP